VPALAYRFDTAAGSVVFSGDTAVNDDLIALARDADILVHQVADLAYLERHGAGRAELERVAASLTDVTQVGNVAERAEVGELILSHYLPAEPDAISDAEWAQRAGHCYSGTTTAGTDGLRRALPRLAAVRQGPGALVHAKLAVRVVGRVRVAGGIERGGLGR
jgi:ribonuclease BN (tRNA processing enzyme)